MSKSANKNWQRVRKIFDEALLCVPEERQKFVAQACGRNKTLKAEVESLLNSLDSAESFLETPAVIKVAEDVWLKKSQFESGRILAHYEIRKQIGAGGMGEVYLAWDTKLNRRVAIKILRENLLSDEQANRRLLREARAAATLEHPNICAIYEISESGDCDFIVMQYAEGETLADILKQKNPSIKDAIDLAIQITDALAEAHSRGIIHRDIKPANIIVNEKNQAKILDFGLAKFIAAESNTQTTERLQSSGAVMGTVPFMSPEQLRGKRLDARTDIFSFGAVFYEMLTGRQIFGRENNAETISAILNDEPDFSFFPVQLQPILRKCLAKNKISRYESAKDLLEDLRGLKNIEDTFENQRISAANGEEDISTLPTETIVTNEPRPKKRQFYFWQSAEEKPATETGEIAKEQTAESKIARRGFSPVFVVLTFFLLVGAFGLFYWQLKKSEDLHSFDNLLSVRLVSWKTVGNTFYNDYRISHNGKMVAFSSNQDGLAEGIFVKQTMDGAEIRVTRDEWSNVSPVWSPDDQRIAFTSVREGKSGIYTIPAFGGIASPLKIIGEGGFIRLRHWSKDGTAIFYETQGNLFRLDISTREVGQITNFPPVENETKYYSFSPDEEKIAYIHNFDGQFDLWMMRIKDGSLSRLTNDRDRERQSRWHADGERILYTVERNNYDQINVAFADGRAPRQVTRGEGDYKLIDISGDGGNIYYHSKESEADIWGVKTETGEEFEVAAKIEPEFWADFSPDNKSIAYQTSLTTQTFSVTADLSIVIKSLTDQFPPLSVKGYNPRWLPDNRRVAFLRRNTAEQKIELWLVNAVSGEEKRIADKTSNLAGYSFLPYNRTETREYSFAPENLQIVFAAKDSGFGNIFAASDEKGEIRNLTNNTNQNLMFRCPLVSPDGKRIVYMTIENPASKNEQPIYKIWIINQDQPQEIYSNKGDLRLLGWTAEGEIVLEKTDAVMAAKPLDISLLRISTTGEKRFETVFKNIYATSMSLSADGKRVVFTVRDNDRDNICIASVSGGEVKKITANGNTKLFYGSPAISPDGKTIFFDKQEETNIISRLENFK